MAILPACLLGMGSLRGDAGARLRSSPPAPLPCSPPATAGAAGSDSVRVGTLTLHRCHPGSVAWCGSLPVPFDRTDPGAGVIDIGFVWYPPTAPGPEAGTIVAEEGGPGYPSSGTRGQYLP